jgi:hypothetical protein
VTVIDDLHGHLFTSVPGAYPGLRRRQRSGTMGIKWIGVDFGRGRQYAYEEVWSCLGVSPRVNQPRTSLGFFFSTIKRPGTLFPFFPFTHSPTTMSHNESQSARCSSYDDVVILDQADTDSVPPYRMSYLGRDPPYFRWNSHRRYDCVRVSQYLVRCASTVC